MGGKGGGGRPDMAQAGGPDGGKAREALAAIERHLEQLQHRLHDRIRRSSHIAASPGLCRCSKAGASGGFFGHVIEAVLITLIVANVLAYTLQSIPSIDLRVQHGIPLAANASRSRSSRVEYLARLWTAPEDPTIPTGRVAAGASPSRFGR